MRCKMETNNHVHVFHDTVVPPACKENGYTLHKCECGYEYKDNFVPMGKHSIATIEDVAPTCTETGKKSYRCLLCGEEKTEMFSPLGHIWGEWRIQTHPTCTEKGSGNPAKGGNQDQTVHIPGLYPPLLGIGHGKNFIGNACKSTQV